MEENNQNGYSYIAPQPQKPERNRAHGTGKLIALALCFALLGGLIGGGGVWLLSQNATPVSTPYTTTILQGKRENVVLDITEIETGKLMSAAEVYAANVASTVGIRTSIIMTNLWGQQTTSAAAGSGFILTEDGYIVTNYHVVEGATSVTVSTYDGNSYNASIVGYDESNDLAVLKIGASGLSPVVLGSSDRLNVGDGVLALGNPLGELTFSLTSGVVSALNREVTFSDGAVMDLIQTDCAINSGNSGGALFNYYGEVIGITNAKYSGSTSSGATIDNIAFAIPIDSVRGIIESIIEKGYYAKPYLGISIATVSSEMQNYGIPAGAVIKAVEAGGSAAAGGLKVNDVVTAVNGTDITDAAELSRVIGKSEVGDTLTLTVWRQNQTLTLTVTVGEKAVTGIQ